MSAPVAASTAAIAGSTSRIRQALDILVQTFDRYFSFDSRRNVVRAAAAMVLLAGCASLLLGQDANWDLRNYHLYNGYALLEGRLRVDLAPAQLQSYFSPLLDVVHYLAMTRLPAPLAGFAFGAWHGLLFLPVSGIAWLVLQGQPQRARLAPLLGIAGMCSAAFLSELGGSMADNTTAIFVLASLFLLLRAPLQVMGPRRSLIWVIGVAGVLLGVAVGLKLTNAIYAIALAVMLLFAPGTLPRRLQAITTLSVAAMLSAGLAAGWWYWSVFSAFGNPLFPQFNAFFQAPLAAPISIADTFWLPRNAVEQMTWPLIFTFDPKRVGQVSLNQCIWALLYAAAAIALLRLVLRRGPVGPAFAQPMRSVVVFFVVAYLLWQVTFSIHRYLVALELLAPLLLWYLGSKVIPQRAAMLWNGLLVVMCAGYSLLGWNTWGHEPWARHGVEVQSPQMPAPDDSVVLLVGDDAQAWRVPFMDPRARYVGVANNFPESSEYRRQVADMLLQRGQHFAMLSAPGEKLEARFKRMNDWAAQLGVSDQPGCARLHWLATRVRGLKSVVEESAHGQCRLQPRPGLATDLPVALEQDRQRAQVGLQPYGLAIAADSCVLLSSRIGQGSYPYQWCRVVVSPAPAPPQGSE